MAVSRIAQQLSRVSSVSSQSSVISVVSIRGQTRTMSGVSSSQILDRINNIVQRHALVSDKYDTGNKVVEFEHPKDLFNLLPLEIGKEGLGDQEMEQIRLALSNIFLFRKKLLCILVRLLSSIQ